MGPMMPGDFTRDELAKLADERAEGIKLNEPGEEDGAGVAAWLMQVCCRASKARPVHNATAAVLRSGARAGGGTGGDRKR